MSDVTEDLRILYRAVSRRPALSGSIAYAGCVTAEEAVRLKRMGVARIVDVQTTDEAAQEQPPLSGSIRVSLGAAASEEGAAALPAALRLRAADHEMLMFLSCSADCSHAAATLAAQAGFYCVLNILDGRERYRLCETD